MKHAIAFLAVLLQITLQATDTPTVADEAAKGHATQLMRDSSFEGCPSGLLASTGDNRGWEVQSIGRKTIQEQLVVACVEDEAKARSGNKCLSLSIPKETEGFEFVTVGQRLGLEAGKVYEASVWVRWPDGPATAPKDARASPAHRSAIVSFWARHRDGRGGFAGRDEWLFDSRWHKLAFRFCATDPDQRTLVYVSLLPNQKPAETTVLLDDFELATADALAETESRCGNLAADSGFEDQQPGRIALPWSFASMGGTNISAGIGGTEAGRWVTLRMPAGTTNFESAQLWQYLELRHGVRYDVSCRMRWDNFAPDVATPIVNYGIYHEASRTWYGPVDQVLQRNAEWNTYRFAHIPPVGGRWKLYVQLNGWGNFSRAVTVSLDEFTCTPAAASSTPP